jgi:hypothetical protein
MFPQNDPRTYPKEGIAKDFRKAMAFLPPIHWVNQYFVIGINPERIKHE